MKVLNILAKESDSTKLTELLPEIMEMVREQLTILKEGKVPLEQLLVTTTLSREPERYSVLSPAAAVAKQLQVYGKSVKRGQRIKYVYIAPAPGVWAWDSPVPPDPKSVDRFRYRELLIRAVQEVLQPLGVTEEILKNWLIGGVGYLAPPGFLKTTDQARLALPLLADVEYLRLDV